MVGCSCEGGRETLPLFAPAGHRRPAERVPLCNVSQGNPKTKTSERETGVQGKGACRGKSRGLLEGARERAKSREQLALKVSESREKKKMREER